MARGGRRQGRPGAGYANRTDLNTKPRLPVTTVPGQPYGAAGQQAAAQQAVPMGTPPVPSPQQAPEAPQYATPDDVMGLHEPSQRPQEPLTHGLPIGAGGGPEVLPANAMGLQAQYSNARDLLAGLAQNNSSPTINTLLASLNGGL